MTTTTRRGALATMAAAATVAVVPAYAADLSGLTPDPVIALADECRSVLTEYVEAGRISHALYGEVCEVTDGLLDQVMQIAERDSSQREAVCQRWKEEFYHQSAATGYRNAHDAWSRVGRRPRKSLTRLFGTPATTLHGVIDKLDVMVAVDREYEDSDTIGGHDEWPALVRADIERLAGKGGAS